MLSVKKIIQVEITKIGEFITVEHNIDNMETVNKIECIIVDKSNYSWIVNENIFVNNNIVGINVEREDFLGATAYITIFYYDKNFVDIWNEAYNIYIEQGKNEMQKYLEKENISKGDALVMIEDIIQTANL